MPTLAVYSCDLCSIKSLSRFLHYKTQIWTKSHIGLEQIIFAIYASKSTKLIQIQLSYLYDIQINERPKKWNTEKFPSEIWQVKVSYSFCAARSISTSGGASAGDSTKCRLGSLPKVHSKNMHLSVQKPTKLILHTSTIVGKKGQKGRYECILLPCKFSSKVKERLLKIVIALCRDLIVLKVLLPMESDLLCFYLPVLHVNLVST